MSDYDRDNTGHEDQRYCTPEERDKAKAWFERKRNNKRMARRYRGASVISDAERERREQQWRQFEKTFSEAVDNARRVKAGGI